MASLPTTLRAPADTGRRAEYLRTYRREWMRRRRASFLEGRSCKTCGSRDHLELHHRDREQKISHRIWSWREERRLAELAKCDVICHSCHELITRAQQRPYRPNRWGFRGVRRSNKPRMKRPFQATISILGKAMSLGYFASAKEAARAYDRKAVELYGRLAITNFRSRRPAYQPELNRSFRVTPVTP